MMTIFPYLCWKLFTGVVLVIAYCWPTFVLVGLAGLCGLFDIERDAKIFKVMSTRLFVLLLTVPPFLLISITYIWWLNLPDPHGIVGTTRTKFMQSYTDYNKQLVDKTAEETKYRINLTHEIERFVLVSWNPPKHFYVTLRNVKTGEIFKDKYVSKHCSFDKPLVAGDEYNLTVTRYKFSNSAQHYIEFHNLSASFC